MPSEAVFPWQTVALLFSGALAIRVITILLTDFDGLYGQDAYAYFDQAMVLRAALLQGVPAPPGFHWPQGYPALVALISLFVGPVPFAAQFVSLVMGSAAAPLTFLVGRRLLPADCEGPAVLAAFFTAISGQAVISSIVGMSDSTAVALALLSMWTVLEFAGTPRRWPLLALAMIFGGAAVATRWAFVLVGPALAVPALKGLGTFRSRRYLVPGFATAACACLGAIVVALVKSQAFDLSTYFSAYFRNWSLLNAVWGPIAEIPPDSLAARVPGIVYYLAPLYHPAYLGPLLCPLAVFGLWKLWKNHDPLISLTLVLWAGVPLSFFVGLPIRTLRFSLTNAAPFAIAAAYGTWLLLRTPALSKFVKTLVAISSIWILGWGANRIVVFTTTVRTTVETARSVAASVPENSIVLAFDITLALKHNSPIETIELYDQDPDSLAHLIETGRPLFLLTQPEDIQRRWNDQTPGINTRWLENNGSLVEVNRWGPYSLRRFEKRETIRTDLINLGSTP